MTETARRYAVSYGNGNDGVSHMYPDFIVTTSEPYRLARLAMVTQFKAKYQAKALAECEVDGEADYTIHAVIYEPLDYEPECDCGKEDHSNCEMPSYSEHNGAAHLADVYLADDNVSERSSCPEYDGIEEAFGKDAALVPAGGE